MTLHDTGLPADTAAAIETRALLTRVWFAVLWLVVGCALAGSFTVFFAEPGRLEEGVAGVMEGEPVTWGSAYVYAATVGLPLVLAAVSLVLPARTSAVSNLVVGVPLAAFGTYAIVSELGSGALHPHAALAVLAPLIGWLIVGLSIALLRWPSHGDPASAPTTVEQP